MRDMEISTTFWSKEMIRTQIQLKEDQYKRLKEMSADKGVSMAHLIRESVEAYLVTINEPSKEELRRRALEIVGKYRDIDGATDVSENHDKYLEEIYGTW